jgi:HAD superfamily hydrolase (TIGR01490 family)
MKHVIAAFDFDGTLTTRDSFTQLIMRRYGLVRTVLTMLTLSPLIAAYAVHLVAASRLKERMFGAFFGGLPAVEFSVFCESFSERFIPPMLRPSAIECARLHREAGHELVIVTASMPAWIAPWAKRNGFSRIIGTEPEVSHGVLTGRFSTPNCRGDEKRRRFLHAYPDRASYELHYYGNGRGDREMLLFADQGHFKRFL